ncbi:MAG: mechanosensitive ion channel [Sinomicrobium sp.]|nr:mechanosensitive ion channel [Sinomicrobium sp.]
MEAIIDTIKDAFLHYGPSILAALILLIAGLFVIGFIMGLSKRIMKKRGVDDTVRKFLSNLIGWTLKVLLFIVVASKLGVETTSFAAVIAAAGLAIGLALQGSLANFAGGVLIMIFKPIKVGDLIEAQGALGEVKEIQIFTTVLVTPDSKTVIVPNGALSNGNIVNYSADGKIRVDLIVGISYDSDIKKAKSVLLKVMEEDDKVLKDPAPSVSVAELADSSVKLAVRPYATVADYWDVYFGTLERCKTALDEARITIPFPQRDVHIKSKD